MNQGVLPYKCPTFRNEMLEIGDPVVDFIGGNTDIVAYELRKIQRLCYPSGYDPNNAFSGNTRLLCEMPICTALTDIARDNPLPPYYRARFISVSTPQNPPKRSHYIFSRFRTDWFGCLTFGQFIKPMKGETFARGDRLDRVVSAINLHQLEDIELVIFSDDIALLHGNIRSVPLVMDGVVYDLG
ncbi:hypothetical protein CO178_00150 [candidate division WWE3 bacterium CG_4_9_14_3_um_filter_34_6]|uniref:Uncharacterized protein n=1 Tax=candidate division WWE3 bacterium CG_4_9_14_3_um_filter_34_6 TaxID=1975079 RepID=A0A2M7X5M5_UNCKA|nr:MAG: hypothetical protein CO178_00150 [candidate division WWE3 bacterium CG_4_9_14_3_um_filter_34_6]